MILFKMNQESEFLKALKENLVNMSPEEKEEVNEIFKDKNPKGWVSVEDSLPMWKAMDITKGYTKYKVKDKNGNEFITQVKDHTTWYYFVAKEQEITHWFNV